MRLTISKKHKPKSTPTGYAGPVLGPGPGRCGAAHADDRSPCEGSIHAVEVSDQFARHVRGCLWHGTLLYSNLVNAVMFPVLEDPATVDAARRIACRLRGLYWAEHDNNQGARR